MKTPEQPTANTLTGHIKYPSAFTSECLRIIGGAAYRLPRGVFTDAHKSQLLTVKGGCDWVGVDILQYNKRTRDATHSDIHVSYDEYDLPFVVASRQIYREEGTVETTTYAADSLNNGLSLFAIGLAVHRARRIDIPLETSLQS